MSQAEPVSCFMRNTDPIRIRPVHVLPSFKHKSRPGRSGNETWGWGGGAPKENTVESVAGSRHQRNLNIPRAEAGIGRTGGVVTVVSARQCSAVQTQCGETPCCKSVNTIRKYTNSCLVI